MAAIPNPPTSIIHKYPSVPLVGCSRTRVLTKRQHVIRPAPATGHPSRMTATSIRVLESAARGSLPLSSRAISPCRPGCHCIGRSRPTWTDLQGYAEGGWRSTGDTAGRGPPALISQAVRGMAEPRYCTTATRNPRPSSWVLEEVGLPSAFGPVSHCRPGRGR